MKAERIRKASREKVRQRARFLSNPYGFSKEVLEEKKAGQLNCSKEVVEAHLKNTHSDQAKHMQIDGHERIDPVPMTTIAFTERETIFNELDQRLDQIQHQAQMEYLRRCTSHAQNC
ncbi:hypothetical protein DPMN_011871 [Dreissena polymorpha]|uniref:Uncharacterized protein n=1 Tax=Dreissena polymorpha TaxID=45954 RepID=A0A9D4S0F4_DREPO|nr:hypothetical protein DPMN_011871 [Dreissena polymorpha]